MKPKKSTETKELIAQAVILYLVFTKFKTEEKVYEWLHTAKEDLYNKTPYKLMFEGKYKKVLRYIENNL